MYILRDAINAWGYLAFLYLYSLEATKNITTIHILTSSLGQVPLRLKKYVCTECLNLTVSSIVY